MDNQNTIHKTYKTNFRSELVNLMNRYSKDNESNTPDFILADYLISCLVNYNNIIKARDSWYNTDCNEKVWLINKGE